MEQHGTGNILYRTYKNHSRKSPTRGTLTFEAFLGEFLGLNSIKEDVDVSSLPLNVVDTYAIDDAGIMNVHVKKMDGGLEPLYEVSRDLPFSTAFLFMLRENVEKDIASDYSILNTRDVNEILDLTIRRAMRLLTLELDGESHVVIETVARMIAFSIIGMETLHPFLIDDWIEEIFVDAPGSAVYLHHAKHDRCKTRVYLTKEDIQRLIGRLRLETNKNLNELNPSLKCVINNPLFYARINVDVKPLSFRGFSLDIRRLNKKRFSLLELVDLNTLNLDMACFLVFLVQSKHNITIIGRTDSGKTTLLNALDRMYPAHFRKVYVEDVVETDEQDEMNSHQLKYQVMEKELKGDLIKDLLHRSPDILILGEILTREESEALFHCLSTGMKGLQTIHARDPASLARRLEHHHHVPRASLEDLDFIVHLTKLPSGERKVVSISELHLLDNGGVEIVSLWKYLPRDDSWFERDVNLSLKLQAYLSSSRFTGSSYSTYMATLKRVLSSGETREIAGILNQVYITFLNQF